MAMYMDGYYIAQCAVETMTREELFIQIDCLYGRGRLSEYPTDGELKREALRQTRLVWLDASDPHYEENRKRLEAA